MPATPQSPDRQIARNLLTDATVARLREELAPNAVHAVATREARFDRYVEKHDPLTDEDRARATLDAEEYVGHDAQARRCLCALCSQQTKRLVAKRAVPAYLRSLDVRVLRGTLAPADRALLAETCST